MTRPLRLKTAGAFVFPALLAVALAAGFAAATNVKPSGVWVFVLVMAGWVITLCLHEFAHSAVALAGGDTSVRARGYLTLNPFRYVNGVYSIVIPVIILAIGGIPLPGGAVLIENHRLKKKWWSSLVSLAGPLTNFILGILLVRLTLFFGGILPHQGALNPLLAGIGLLALLQFVTAILNILPIPGFDGFGVLAPYLPPAVAARLAPTRQWAPLIFFFLLISSPTFSQYLFQPAYDLMRFFGLDPAVASAGFSQFRFWN